MIRTSLGDAIAAAGAKPVAIEALEGRMAEGLVNPETLKQQ